MKQVLIYSSEDPYTYDNVRLVFQRSYPISDDTMETTVKDYIQHFKNGGFSSMHLIVQDFNHDTGEVNILQNFTGKNPLKVRIEINQKALEARKQREGSSVKFAKANPHGLALVTAATPMPVVEF